MDAYFLLSAPVWPQLTLRWKRALSTLCPLRAQTPWILVGSSQVSTLCLKTPLNTLIM